MTKLVDDQSTAPGAPRLAESYILVVNRLYYVSEDTVHTAKRYPICLFLIDKFFVHRAGVRTSARLFFKRGA